MTDDELTELDELYRCTIPAPWDGVISTGCVRYLGDTRNTLQHGDTVASCRNTGVALLIAEMHRLLPALIEDARRLRGMT